MDDTDLRILRALDDDPRRPVAILAQILGLARGTVHNRLDGLLASTALRPNSARVSPAALGLPIRAVVTASVRQNTLRETMDALASIAEVVECLAMAGDVDIMLHVVARDTDHLYEIGQHILHVPGIQRTSTSVVLREHLSYRMRQLLG